MRLLFAVAAVLCLSAALVTADAEAEAMAETVSGGLRSEVEANAAMVADINAAAEVLRAEKAADTNGAKKFFCKTIKESQAHELSWISKFLSSKYGKWIPATEKSISVYLQAEANAAAFVGVGAGVGIGVDITLTIGKSTRQATGKIRVFACLSGAVSVGYVGAKASAGAGLYVGFAKNFQEGIGSSQIEIGFDIQAGPAPLTMGIGILVRLGDKNKQGFVKGWGEYTKKVFTGTSPSKKEEYKLKAQNLFGQVASGVSQEFEKLCPNVRVVGVAFHVAAGVGTGFKTEVSVDVLDLVNAFKSGVSNVWKKFNFKTPKFVSKIKETLGAIKAKLKPASDFFDFKPADD